MKKIIIILNLIYYDCTGQDVVNPYIDYDGLNYSLLRAQNNSNLFYNINTAIASGPYNGEYEILLDNFPWGDPAFIEGPIAFKLFDLNNYAISYQIELISFPFSMDCAFPSADDPNAGCIGLTTRELNMPENSYFDLTTKDKWTYPVGDGTVSNKLWNITLEKPFERQPNAHTISDPLNNNNLVSSTFGTTGSDITHSVLPHSILKHTINLHCGPAISQPVISSFSFIVDLTRGMLREYPYRDNSSSHTIVDHDLLIRPILISGLDYYDQNNLFNCTYSHTFPNSSCDGQMHTEGSNINYTPFDPILDDNCSSIILDYHNAEYGNAFYSTNSFGSMHRLPICDYSIPASTSIRNFDGTTLAGYKNYFGQTSIEKVLNISSLTHKYTIDKNIIIKDRINPSEKIIYNPSEVNITASNLIFPTNYTFKTIRGIFPFASEVDAAADDLANGGPFTDPTKRDVPVVTDLFKDFHVSSTYDPTNIDHRYSSIYHLISGSKLTIEPCVKIFDATFEINPGSEIVFEDWSTNQINVNRYQLLFYGGIVTKRDDSFLFQNKNEIDKMLNWEAANNIAAGANVDPNNTAGEYTVEPNAHVTFEASNYIDLASGFNAKSGSEFEASIKPVTIPPCGPMRLKNPRSNNTVNENTESEIGYFTITPNPTRNDSYFMFELFDKSNTQIIIYDSMGKIVQRVGENSYLPSGKYSFKYQSENLTPGIYFAKLLTASSVKSVKFIKQ